MGEERPDYRKPDISASDVPRNHAGMEFLEVRLDSIEVTEWHPFRDGRGKPTEVHVLMRLQGIEDLPLMIRFKSPGTLDAVIAALATHRFNVWLNQSE